MFLLSFDFVRYIEFYFRRCIHTSHFLYFHFFLLFFSFFDIFFLSIVACVRASVCALSWETSPHERRGCQIYLFKNHPIHTSVHLYVCPSDHLVHYPGAMGLRSSSPGLLPGSWYLQLGFGKLQQASGKSGHALEGSGLALGGGRPQELFRKLQPVIMTGRS